MPMEIGAYTITRVPKPSVGGTYTDTVTITRGDESEMIDVDARLDNWFPVQQYILQRWGEALDRPEGIPMGCIPGTDNFPICMASRTREMIGDPARLPQPPIGPP